MTLEDQIKITEVVDSLNKTKKGGLICRFCVQNTPSIIQRVARGDKKCIFLIKSFHDLVLSEIDEQTFIKIINVPEDDVIDCDYK